MFGRGYASINTPIAARNHLVASAWGRLDSRRRDTQVSDTTRGPKRAMVATQRSGWRSQLAAPRRQPPRRLGSSFVHSNAEICSVWRRARTGRYTRGKPSSTRSPPRIAQSVRSRSALPRSTITLSAIPQPRRRMRAYECTERQSVCHAESASGLTGSLEPPRCRLRSCSMRSRVGGRLVGAVSVASHGVSIQSSCASTPCTCVVFLFYPVSSRDHCAAAASRHATRRAAHEICSAQTDAGRRKTVAPARRLRHGASALGPASVPIEHSSTRLFSRGSSPSC